MFGFPIICYLFAGGLGGGLCVVCAVAMLFVPASELRLAPNISYRRIFVPAFVIAAASLVIGMLFLLADVGRLDAIEYLILAPVLRYLNVGAWMLVATTVLCIGLAAFWASGADAHTRARRMALRAASVLAAVLGLGVAAYTGLFLAGMKAVPLWHVGAGAVLPTLFVASSLSCGAAVLTAILHLTCENAAFGAFCRTLAKGDLVLIVVEVAAAAILLMLALHAPATPTDRAAAEAAHALISGAQAPLWWGGFVGAGLAIAAFCDNILLGRKPHRRTASPSNRILPADDVPAVVLALAALVGAFAMRAALVASGVHPIIVMS